MKQAAADIVALRTQHQQLQIFEKHAVGLQDALAAGKMEMQKQDAGAPMPSYDSEAQREEKMYGNRHLRTDGGKQLDSKTGELTDSLRAAVQAEQQRSQQLARVEETSSQMVDASAEFADRAKRLKEKLAMKNDTFSLF